MMESDKNSANIANNSLLQKKIKPFLSRCYKKKFYIYYNHQVSGKRTKLSTKTIVRSEAEIILRRFIMQNGFNSDSITSNVGMKISELLERILSANTKRKAPKTLSIYKLAFDHFTNIIGNKPVSSITGFECEKYINGLINNERKFTTINIYFRTMRAAFNRAIFYGIITTNPFNHLRELEMPENTRPIILKQEQEILLKVIDDEVFIRLVIFAILTGMRLGEIAYLQWDDINYTDKIINIKNKEVHKTKTRKDRKIPLTEAIQNVLKVPQYGNIYDMAAKESYVFCKSNGMGFTPEYISRKFKKYVRKAKLNDSICFHCLRHTSATIMSNSNIPLKLVQDALGHASSSTTQRYLHTQIEVMRQYMEKVDFGNFINNKNG